MTTNSRSKINQVLPLAGLLIGLWAGPARAEGGMAMGESMKMERPSRLEVPLMDPREANGTAWQPAATPLFAKMRMAGKYMLMFHWNATLDFNHGGGRLGETQVGSSNWWMGMAARPVGAGRLMLRTMVTAEPWTWGLRGYPELFQGDEVLHGVAIENRMHPHDLFMELAAEYDRPVGRNLVWHVYAAPVGDAALGSAVFLHRLSASDNVEAPLGHDQEDEPHGSYGVVTTGLTRGPVRVEGSVFNGRDPDANNRYDFDFASLSSYSGRVSYNPAPGWSFQISGGHLVGLEASKPDVSSERATASAHYTRSSERGYWATSLIWGQNHQQGDPKQASLTFESDWKQRGTAWFTRMESVQRLDLPGLSEGQRTTVKAMALGWVRDIQRTAGGDWAFGVQADLYVVPRVLRGAYGSHPASFHVFLRFRAPPLKSDTGSMESGGMPPM